MHVNQTIDRNTHSQSASISAIIDEQGDIRKLVEDLASRLDRSCKNRSHCERAPNLVQSTTATATWSVRSNRLWSSHNDDEP